jgi:tRNA-dihydrouridine synthase B
MVFLNLGDAINRFQYPNAFIKQLPSSGHPAQSPSFTSQRSLCVSTVPHGDELIAINGNFQIAGIGIHGAVLAPMAGYTDSGFRRLCKRFGAGLVFTELISAEGLARNGKKTWQLIRFLEEERPIGIQLFGGEPDVMAEAARRVETVRPDFIDLNFGCPARKVVRRGEGSALLKDLRRLEEIARAVVESVRTPVTAKIRSGWDDDQIVAEETSRILDASGVAAVSVHARTQKMGFRGRADWDVIRRVKKSVRIPVIGNGDVTTAEDALRMMRETGCDSVMIGRGVFGKPWVFGQINAMLGNGGAREEPSHRERIDIAIEHLHLAVETSGECRAVREMRKHIGWYLKGIPEHHEIKQKVFRLESAAEVESCLADWFSGLKTDSR